jgi:hypothetical protein
VTYPTLLHPYKVWITYPFWQKCMFSRLVDKKSPALSGKFDCFDKSFLKSVGFFDNKTFRTAGEDSDLKIKIAKLQRSIVASGVEVVHLQYIEKDFGLKKFLKKEAQYAEAQGVVLRKYGIHNIKGVILSFFREILLIGLFIPYLNFFFFAIIAIYAFAYTRLVYITEYKDLRILILPFVNVFILFVAAYASITGFIRGKQVI